MKQKPNGIRKEVEKVMKENGWIDQVEVAEKIHKPVLEVDKVLTELEKEGLVESRPAK